MKENLFTEFSYLFTHRYALKDECTVSVVFIYKETGCVTLPIHIKKEEGHDFSEKAYYVDKARRIIQKMIKDGSLNSYSKKYLKDKKDNKFLKILTSVIGVYGLAGIAVGIFFACYKPSTPQATYKAELDAPAGVAFSNTIVKEGEDFSTDIFVARETLDDHYILPTKLTSVTSNGEEISNYTYTLDEDAHTAILTIPKESVKGSINVTIDLYRPNLCFTAMEANSTVGYWHHYSSIVTEIETSTDEINWTSWNGESITLANVGDKLYVRNKKDTLNTADWGHALSFSSSGKFDLSGDVASMINFTDLKDGCFAYLFGGSQGYIPEGIVSAHRLIVRGEALTTSCCREMFNDCVNLVTAPKILPAVTLGENCYKSMFEGCSSLVNAPELPAMNLDSAWNCYDSMFKDCSSLINAPKLPATTLGRYCYQSMFEGCSSLVNAPALPATGIRSGCYQSMFSNCDSLVNAPALPATGLVSSCYQSMFSNCISLVKTPKLPAPELADYCYYQMFDGCTSLEVSENSGGEESNLIFTCPPTIGQSVTDMFIGTSGTFTGTPTAGNKYYFE